MYRVLLMVRIYWGCLEVYIIVEVVGKYGGFCWWVGMSVVMMWPFMIEGVNDVASK